MKRLISVLVVVFHLAGCTTLTAAPYSQGTFERDPVQAEEFSALKTIGAVAGIALAIFLIGLVAMGPHPMHFQMGTK